jgi:hypothetical protein
MYADANKKTYNMVVEIPRWTNAKMEVKEFPFDICNSEFKATLGKCTI